MTSMTIEHRSKLSGAIHSVIHTHGIAMSNYTRHGLPESVAFSMMADDLLVCARPMIGPNFLNTIREYVSPEELANTLYDMIDDASTEDRSEDL